MRCPETPRKAYASRGFRFALPFVDGTVLNTSDKTTIGGSDKRLLGHRVVFHPDRCEKCILIKRHEGVAIWSVSTESPGTCPGVKGSQWTQHNFMTCL